MSDDRPMAYPSVRHDLIPDFFEVARALVEDHAALLAEHPTPPVRVLTLVKTCPRCSGRVVSAVDDPLSARCAAGCGWSARRFIFS